MLSKSGSVIVLSFLVLFAATPLRAQHSQGHAPQAGPGGGGSVGPAATLGSLLKASDEAMRGLGAAVDGGDRQLAERWAEAYVDAADDLGAWSDGADLTRIERDLSRAVAALERQTKRLTDLSTQAPRELREVLGSALDAAHRASDMARAAREEARSAGTSAGHHKNTRRGGCGRH